MDKKAFQEPKIEVIKFGEKDVITMSENTSYSGIVGDYGNRDQWSGLYDPN